MKSDTSSSNAVSVHKTKSRKHLSSFASGDIKAESKLESSVAPGDMKRESKVEGSSKICSGMETLNDPLLQLKYPRFPLYVGADMLGSAALSDKRTCVHMAMEEGEEAKNAEKEMEEEEEEEEEDFDDGDTDISFEFSCSMSLDLPQEHKILSAEELFFNGKLRPLQAEDSNFYQNPEDLHQIDIELPSSVERKEAMERSSHVKEANLKRSMGENYKHGEKMGDKAADLQRNLPMVKTSLHQSLAMAKEHLRSLHESPRCLSMTIEGSRGQPRRSCVSLTNSRCSSPSRSRPSGTFSQPRTTPTSPKAHHSSQKTKTFLHFFKLKKHLTSINKDVFSSSSESVSASGSSRLSRAFWPFSRSNSAGESKSSHGVSPLPRRSNSAGESKTTSSALLPNNPIKLHDGENKGESSTASFVLSARKPQVGHFNHQQAEYKKGLPPLIPSASSKKASSYFVLTNCGSDSAALSQPVADAAPCIPAPTPTPTSSLSSCTPTPTPPFLHTNEEVSHVSKTQSSPWQGGEGDHLTHTQTQSSSPILPEFKALASPGRHVRHASATNPVRTLTRGSPARQWSNPNMGGSTRGSLQRYGPTPPPRGLMRPKDALSRETVSVRVAPVLNVPACMTPSSKSKLFNLGNLFSKKEKAARGYTMLVSTDSQSGG